MNDDQPQPDADASDAKIEGGDSPEPSPGAENGLSPQAEVSPPATDLHAASDPTATELQAANPPSRSLRWHRWIVLLLVGVFFAYMVGLPLVSNWIEQFRPQKLITTVDEMSFGEAVRLRAMEALTGLWFLALGGTIGSFLNVVAYRMPRGQSVVFQPSRCPRCGSRIPGRDNIPVLGWLLLNGRCRACGCKISARYPMVEGLMAVMFLLFFLVELITGGSNLPVHKPPTYTGIVWIIFYTKWDIVLLYLYHCLLGSILVVWMLIDIDRQRITLAARVIVFSLLLLPVLIWPHLLPVPLNPAGPGSYDPSLVDSAINCLVGAAAGLALGGLLWAAGAGGHIISGLGWVGMGVGWQAAVAVALICLLLRAVGLSVTRLIGRTDPPPTAFLLIAFVGHHLLWRWCVTNLSPWWPGPETTTTGWLLIAGVLVLLLILSRFLWGNCRIEPEALPEVKDLETC
jgi:leader peptidase (prepilin peptidase) / N-methyltransferase